MATPIPSNQAVFSLGELVAATGGRLVDADPATTIAGISADSRTVPAGGLFVALWVAPGGPIAFARDGHDFVAAARQRGAFPLVERSRDLAGPRLEVDDTLVALGEIARHFVARETRGRPVPALAVGGAVGKTTTKTLAAAAAEALFGPALVTAGSLNNLLGVPMTLFTLGPSHRALVIECGTSTTGEIPRLGRIVQPDVALVLNADIEHSAGLGDLTAIADEEGSLFAAARRAAITWHEDLELMSRLAQQRSGRGIETFTFGHGTAGAPPPDVRIAGREVRDDGTTAIALELSARLSAGGPRPLVISTPLLGAAAANNLAAAVAATAVLRGEPLSVDELGAVAAALGAVPAVPGRLTPRRFGRILVIDDSYNANPRSMRAALAAAREVADRRGARLIVALGDMLELGELSRAMHGAVLEEAERAAPALLALVGSEMLAAVRARGLALPRLVAASSETMAPALAMALSPGDVLLIKGSRGMRMERLLEPLAARFGAEG